eukprot:gene3844-15140_t
MEELFTVGNYQKPEMETERKHPAVISNSGVERAVSNVDQRQKRKLLSIFNHFTQNFELFLDIAKLLTESTSDEGDVIEKLSDSFYRRSVFTKLKSQAEICLKDLIFLDSLADDESINSKLKKLGKTVRKTMKSLDRMLETIEIIDKVRL